MEEKDYRDITEWMAEKLRSHSVPYQEGAWEQFEKKRHAPKRGPRPLWPWFSGVAAVLLLCFALFLRKEPTHLRAPIAHTSTVDASAADQETGTASREGNTAPLGSPLKKMDVPSRIQSSELAVSSPEVYAQVNKVDKTPTVVTKEQVPSKPVARKPTESTPNKESTGHSIAPSVEEVSLIAKGEPVEPASRQASSTKNWNFGVALAPTMSKDKMNFGGGIAVAYSVSDKVAIRSGITYMQLDAHRSAGSGNGGGAALYPSLDAPSSLDGGAGKAAIKPASKTLNAVYTNLTGLDIPINVEYKINDRFFASAGVSVFGVLEEKRTNYFRSEVQEVSYAVSGDRNNLKQNPTPVVKTMFVSEPTVNEPYKDHSFTGFLNFSFGYKMPFSSKISLSVEPFYKVPVGRVSTQDMDLSNGGIRITAGF